MRYLSIMMVSVFFTTALSAAEPQWLNFNFEDGSLAGWVQQKDGQASEKAAEIVANFPASGKRTLKMEFDAPGTRRITRVIPIPPREGKGPRSFRIIVPVSGVDMEADEIQLHLCEKTEKGTFRTLRRGSRKEGPFALLPAAHWHWREPVVQGVLSPNAKALELTFQVSSRDDRGRVLLDYIRGDLIDHGLLFQSDRIGNIFPAERASLDLAIAGAGQVDHGQVTLKDEAGKILKTIPVPAGRDWMEIELPTRGYYDLAAEVTYKDGQTATAHTTAVVAGPLIPDEKRMKSRYGFQSPYDLLAIPAGGRWARVGVGYESYADKKGSFAPPPKSSRRPRKRKSTPMTAGFQQAKCLQDRKGKPWDHPHKNYPIKDLKGLTAAIRYDAGLREDPLDYYEVGNEFDYNWQGTPAELVEYHRQVARAVHAVNPKAKIIGPSPANLTEPNLKHKMTWLKTLVDHGLLKHVDILSVHTYVKGSTPPEQDFLRGVRALKAYLRSIGKQNLPLFVTEYGWTMPPGDWQKPLDPLTHARYVSRSLTFLTAEEFEAIFYFRLHYPGPNPALDGYALLARDYTPRPGYAAYANLTRFLTGVTGPGKVLQLTPTTYLALFRRDEKTVAVAWTTKGTSNIFLPTPWTEARDMTGRPIATPADGLVTVSESPTFIVLPDTSLYDIRIGAKSRRISQAQRIKTGLQPVWTPAPLSVSNGTLDAPANAPAGPYHLLCKAGENWRAAPIRVDAPLELISSECTWPINAKTPMLQLAVKSNLPQPARLSSAVQLSGVPPIRGETIAIAPGQQSSLAIPLKDLTFGKRYRGELVLRSDGKIAAKAVKLPLDVTILPHVPRNRMLPAIDISAWSPFGGRDNAPTKVTPENCSAQLQMGYNELGLRVRITVRDDVHRQPHAPTQIWRADSVQLAFDMDADKPWVANAGGWTGHFKVFEYGFALGKSGPVNWRWISYDDALPAKKAERRIKPKITRKGDVTTYDIIFPWATLGLKKPPTPGTSMGFSIVVNDLDNQGRRVGLRLFDGIVESKNPAEFGKLYFR